jgi:predicted DNA-binding transcriptional regulator AlpA
MITDVQTASPRMISAQEVASKLSCSHRHVLRLNEGGKMPIGVRIGKLVRWEERVINDWIAAGCNQNQDAN